MPNVTVNCARYPHCYVVDRSHISAIKQRIAGPTPNVSLLSEESPNLTDSDMKLIRDSDDLNHS
jgi:hypothetical protein